MQVGHVKVLREFSVRKKVLSDGVNLWELREEKSGWGPCKCSPLGWVDLFPRK